ncbi:MAG TPA: hypothetical protein VFR67_17270 [Pilimelia sp.]|nr:hypothetical protein [Pilimelia sp.]
MGSPHAPHDPLHRDDREPGAVVTDAGRSTDDVYRDDDEQRGDESVPRDDDPDQTARVQDVSEHDDAGHPDQADQPTQLDRDELAETHDRTDRDTDLTETDERTDRDTDLTETDDRTDQDTDLTETDDRTDRDTDLTDRDADVAGREDRSPFAEPEPQPTAFGAATVGGAVAASAAAQPPDTARREPEADTTTRPLDVDTEAGPDTGPVDRLEEEPAAAERDRVGPEAEEPVWLGPGVAEPAGAEPSGAEPGELKPGDVPSLPVAALWEDDAAQGFRDRWREVQLRFVDDPMEATGEAQVLVGEVVESLTATLVERRTDIDGWRSAGNGDTEHLRVVIRRYRDFLDRLLSL